MHTAERLVTLRPHEAEILDILAAETGADRAKLVPGATIDDLGIASIDLIQAIFALETRFGIDIPVVAERSGEEFATVGALVNYVLPIIAEAERAAAAPSGRVQRSG